MGWRVPVVAVSAAASNRPATPAAVGDPIVVSRVYAAAPATAARDDERVGLRDGRAEDAAEATARAALVLVGTRAPYAAAAAEAERVSGCLGVAVRASLARHHLEHVAGRHGDLAARETARAALGPRERAAEATAAARAPRARAYVRHASRHGDVCGSGRRRRARHVFEVELEARRVHGDDVGVGQAPAARRRRVAVGAVAQPGPEVGAVAGGLVRARRARRVAVTTLPVGRRSRRRGLILRRGVAHGDVAAVVVRRRRRRCREVL
mmetsp:Transcript_2644/g.9218  ORF Transcript_2644/g.9218 Transcript_2644/m.9218 type:complete len:266 (-) Transcript_2644:3797-4594(-)